MVLEVRDLRMRYGTTDVLTGVSFTAGAGEVLALLGPNGAGKTTTIEILEGFRMRSAGEVSVLGVDPAHGGEGWRARIGVVLQSWRDHSKWRVGELLAHLASYFQPAPPPPPRPPESRGGGVGRAGGEPPRAKRHDTPPRGRPARGGGASGVARPQARVVVDRGRRAAGSPGVLLRAVPHRRPAAVERR